MTPVNPTASARAPGAEIDEGAARFRRTMSIALVSLLVLCGALVGLNFFQGPKLENIQMDTSTVTTQPNAQLRMFANQRVADIRDSQVTVTPEASVTVSTEGEVITVQFDERLRSATDYEVSVEGVTSVFIDRPTTFRHDFTTDPEALLYLDRNDPAQTPDGPDAIISTVVTDTGRTDSGRTVEYEARGIQSFAVVGDLLAVVTLRDDGSNDLTLVSRLDGTEERLLLPDTGVVDNLQGSSAGGRIGFVFSSSVGDGEGETTPEFSQILFTVDLAGSHEAVAVPGLDGSALGVLDWVLEPDGSAGGVLAIAQTFDETLLRVDLTGAAPPTPLGQYTSLGRVSLDGRSVVVGDLYGSIDLDLATLDETRVPALALDGELPFGGELQLLGEDLARVQQVAIFDYDDGTFESYLLFDDLVDAVVLYQDPTGRGSLESFTVSPNGQYAAVTVVPDVAAGVSDGYLIAPESTSVSTLIIDIESGAIVRSVDGFSLIW